MNQEVKALWLAALRSGEYRQTRKRLHDDIGYCCLGVLCEVHRSAMGGEWTEPHEWAGDGVTDYMYSTGNSSSRDAIPFDVRAWAGLDSCVPWAEKSPLVDYNDGREGSGDIVALRPHTFAEIADLIEQHL